jgi:hypothetical protein
MQTLSSSFGDILPAALDVMKKHLTAFSDVIRVPSPEKVSHCEDVIKYIKTKGCAYVVVWFKTALLDMMRVVVIKKASLPISRYASDCVTKLFCPLIRFVDNERLPEAFRQHENEHAPTHVPLLFIKFKLVDSPRMKILNDTVIETQFTNNKLENMTLHIEQ